MEEYVHYLNLYGFSLNNIAWLILIVRDQIIES